MRKLLPYACLTVGIGMASCTGKGTALLPPGASTPAAAPARIPQGWAPTATKAVPIKNFPTGSVPATTQMHIVVGLYMRDRMGAQQLVRDQYTPGHASFHQWLTPAEFTAKFNPTFGRAAAVADYLKHEGFTRVSIEPNHLIVSAVGTVARAEAAFHTSIRGTASNGKYVYGNVSPAFVPE
ncbi:MAG: hypothetical protein JO101_07920, partial [Candidatus Eremiobacteraeota bacterium]|nr:hypothetical protein [Candidatus Eremiobacteraeota bacterium]